MGGDAPKLQEGRMARDYRIPHEIAEGRAPPHLTSDVVMNAAGAEGPKV